MILKNRSREYLFASIFSIIGASSITYFSCDTCRTDVNDFLITAFFSSLMWFIMWVGNGELTLFISNRLPWVKFPVKRFIAGVISTVVFTVVVAMLLIRTLEAALNFKLSNYSETILMSLIITFLISFFLHARSFLLQWRQSAVESERYQKQSMMAQYESLKNQVNPHFLFNSLNALTNLVYQDQDKAVKFIKQLSEVYRYVLESRNKDVVAINDELDFIKSYVFLQHIRFGDKLHVNIEFQSVHGEVAPLALQMLVENAIKHNVISEQEPLSIRLYKEGEFICVENNINKKVHSIEEGSGLGLENIIKRYRFLTDVEVKIDESASFFKVSLPILSHL